ncbi:DUF1453 family protein [Paenibacillus silvae]|uniref:CcdC protein domain-containing protein n=2 Tax=Paenibacillus silvae TaxID=1325358 RepID=UPI002002AEEC|nr:CcdC protein domain-containing protein [Paenibacillus silvae]MCK6078167.1 DUF1453 family protein [Paenibacillus silvae]MCK6152509.1 DUF1453 family protein [Paenibacillus silvae]MCK6271096.1 DUF1453 family protein [Paenibacillus silvae]
MIKTNLRYLQGGTMTTDLWISTIAIFAVLVYSSFGRKRFNMIRILLPFVFLSYFGFTYLKDIPTDGNNLWLLVASILIGAVFGTILISLSRVDFDINTQQVYVFSGFASIGILSLVFILRIILIELITNNGEKAYRFAMEHHFNLNIIGPLFIFMTAAMITIRVIGTLIQVNRSKASSSQKA